MTARRKPFRTEFLRGLRARGLDNVQQVISDSHSGLVKAIRRVFIGAAWRRCRVHFVRNVFAVIEKGSAEMVAATIRTIFAQSTAVQVRDQLNVVADMLGRQSPRSGRCCRTRPVTSPPSPTSRLHTWKKIWSTNPLERLNGEVKRRADVVQVFADRAAALERLASAALADLHDGWQVSDRRYFSEASMVELLTDKPIGTPTNELTSQPGPTTPVE